MTTYIIERNILKTTEFEIQFQYDIDSIECIDNMYLVLLKIPKGSKEVDNLLGVDSNGKVIWKVQNAGEAFGILQNTPYVAMHIVDSKKVKVTSFFGFRFTVSIVDGKLLEKEHLRW